MPGPDPASVIQETFGLVRAVERVLQVVTDRGRVVTNGGKDIDQWQPAVARLATLTAEARAAEESAVFASKVWTALGEDAGYVVGAAACFAADVAKKVDTALRWKEFPWMIALGSEANLIPDRAEWITRCLDDKWLVGIGRKVMESGGRHPASFGVDTLQLDARRAAQQFADKKILPIAHDLHVHDGLVSDEIITQMAEMGFFGMSIPEEFGGSGMGNPAMIVTTEELSRASLAGAGSLITRPEILAKALEQGGTPAQKEAWLPRIASGELMVAVAVTEPNVGSDVASVTCKATRTTIDGRPGYVINGAKAWCTFAGRADILALLARTDPDLSKGAKGLSLFIVEKDRAYGHEFETTQPHGGKISGTAIPTPGYRGMHSFMVDADSYFVPEANRIGDEGKGFYLQMAGFGAGRLQTAGRATGVLQRALEVTTTYAGERSQFGCRIGEFGNTLYELGWVAAWTQAARAISLRAAAEMDSNPRNAVLPAMAKLFACSAAEDGSERLRVLFGGWGYGEEFVISQLVTDSQVLSLFEGTKPVLQLKVIGRGLLASE